MHRICIVGSGVTGALTAMMLKEKLPQINIIIFEKSKGTGGRMCTSRSPFGSSVDIGAQFITKTSDISHTQEKCYSELLQTGLLKPLQGRVEGLKDASSYSENYVCSRGSGSIVKHFLQFAGCEILFDHKVTRITSSHNKLKLLCDNNSSHEFDAVILTMPVPQVLQLDGITSFIQNEELKKLRAVEYCSRFALGLFYKCNTNFFDSLSWTAKYISEDPVICFCSIDHLKRGKQLELPSLIIHTTKEFGKKNIDADVVSIQSVILESLENILPHMPKPSCTKAHKWRYSQVEKSYSGKPGCLVVSTSPVLICGGDGFSYSTFEGCILSAENIAKNFTENFIT